MIYLDHNATTPLHENVIEAMARAARNGWANPSSLHDAGRQARRYVDDARESVAALVAESPRDVVFTSGGTEANNLGLLRLFAEDPARGFLITSLLEHPSVLASAEALQKRGVRVLWLPIRSDGHLQPASLAEVLRDTQGQGVPTLVAVHAVHHETGAIQPVQEILRVAEQAGAQVHVDAVQAAGRVPHALWRGAHSVALAAHKIRGPKGIGAIATRPGIALRPLLRGGNQERGLRPGTLDAISAAGFGVAAKQALEGGPERYASLQPLRDAMERGLEQLALSLGVDIQLTLRTERAPHVSHLLVGSWRGDELVAALDLQGVCVSSGSACSAGTAEPSAAIAALVGLERARGALRISLGETSNRADADAFLDACARVLARGHRVASVLL